MEKRRIGIFSGSFNPIHHGHLMLANYIVEFCKLDEVWFVVSPRNPFKSENELLPEENRLIMVKEAIKGYNKFKASDIEFNLPKPSYTINTLEKLKDSYPNNEFKLIIGEDNLINIKKWKDYTKIINDFGLIVYKRYIMLDAGIYDKNIQIINDSPIITISSTFIRESIKNNKDVRYFLPIEVWNIIKTNNYYK